MWYPRLAVVVMAGLTQTKQFVAQPRFVTQLPVLQSYHLSLRVAKWQKNYTKKIFNWEIHLSAFKTTFCQKTISIRSVTLCKSDVPVSLSDNPIICLHFSLCHTSRPSQQSSWKNRKKFYIVWFGFKKDKNMFCMSHPCCVWMIWARCNFADGVDG